MAVLCPAEWSPASAMDEKSEQYTSVSEGYTDPEGTDVGASASVQSAGTTPKASNAAAPASAGASPAVTQRSQGEGAAVSVPAPILAENEALAEAMRAKRAQLQTDPRFSSGLASGRSKPGSLTPSRAGAAARAGASRGSRDAIGPRTHASFRTKAWESPFVTRRNEFPVRNEPELVRVVV